MRAVPDGRIGGIILQLRQRARQAERRSVIVLFALLVTIAAGLVFYLGLPFWQQYTDSRLRTLEKTIEDVNKTAQKLTPKRSKIKNDLEKYLYGQATNLFRISIKSTKSIFINDKAILLYGKRVGSLFDWSYIDLKAKLIFSYDLKGIKANPYSASPLINIFYPNEIVYSNDGGKTFSIIEDDSAFSLKGHIILKNKTLILFGEKGAITRSVDYGKTFSTISSGTKNALLNSIRLNDGSIILFGFAGTIVRSVNNGKTFAPVPSGTNSNLLNSILLKDGSIIVYGLNGAITRSVDRGKTFKHTTLGKKINLYRHILLGHETIILYGDSGTITRSDDGGKMFTLVPLGTRGSLRNHILQKNKLILLYGDNGEISRSDDGGKNFSLVKSGTKSSLGSHILLKDGTILLYGYDPARRGADISHTINGVIIRSTDGGKTFTTIPSGTKNRLGHHILFENGTILLYGEKGTITRSEDSGKTFSVIHSGTDSLLSGHALSMNGTVFLYGDHGAITRSTDGGKTFTVIPTGTNSLIRGHIRFKDDSILLFGDQAAIRISNELAVAAKKIVFPELAISLQNMYDKKLDAFFDKLPSYLQQGERFRKLRTSLLRLIARRSVLDERRSAIEAAKAEAKSTSWIDTILSQKRETFRRFMEVCRGRLPAPTPAPQKPLKPDAVTLACTQAWKAQKDAEGQNWWQTIARTVPPGVLLLFLLATLGGLYRYNLRLAGFHHSRADALGIFSERYDGDDITAFTGLANALAADKVEFGKANTPVDHASEIMKAALSGKGK